MMDEKFVNETSVKDKWATPQGRFILEIKRASGEVEHYVLENLVVNQGKDYIARNTIGVSTVNLNYIVVTDSTASPDPNRTSMPVDTSGNLRAKLATKSVPSARTAQWQATFDNSGGDNLTFPFGSIGICVNSDGTGLFAYAVRTPTITLGSNDSITITYQWIIS